MTSIEISRKPLSYEKVAQNNQATGAATAISAQGPMLINELWFTTIDTTNRWGTSAGGTATLAKATDGPRIPRDRPRTDCRFRNVAARAQSAPRP